MAAENVYSDSDVESDYDIPLERESSEEDSEYDFIEPLPDDLMCLICMSVADEPQQLTCCGKIYCENCIENLGRDSPCPNCRSTNWQQFEDKRSSRNIKALKIRCPKKDDGCDWIGELREKHSHSEECGYELVECKNECLYEQQDIFGFSSYEITTISRRLEKIHLEKECPRRIVHCELCDEEGEYEDITGSHVDECPEVIVNCLNEDCNDMMKRSMAEEHTSICPYEIIPCKYARHGCPAKVARKDMADHEKDTDLHLERIANECDSLREDLASTKQLLEEVQCAVYNVQADLGVPATKRVPPTDRNQVEEKPLKVVTFKVDNVADNARNERHIYSLPFNTSKGGYRMCVQVGFESKNSYDVAISTYFFMMKGDNDDNLEWPFRPAKIRIELLNQTSDSEHCEHTVVYSRERISNKRVTDGERGKRGYGVKKLTSVPLRSKPLGLLFNSLASNNKYLVDDSLFFRVTVLEAPQPKPWLVCNI